MAIYLVTLIRLFNGSIALRSKSLSITATKAMGSKASCHLLCFSICQDEENRVFPRWFSGKPNKSPYFWIFSQKLILILCFFFCSFVGTGWWRFYFWHTNNGENGNPHLGSSKMADALHHTLFFHILFHFLVQSWRPLTEAGSQSPSYRNHIQSSKW